MSHTLHRLGTPENLAEDFVVFAMSAKGINEEGSAPKLRRFLELALAYDPVNYGDMKTGNRFTSSLDEIVAGIQDISVVHAVFTHEEPVADLLRDLEREDLGVSVVVSGLFDRVGTCAKEAGLRQHTVEYSLGIWGRTDRLPDQDILQVTTMCGHGMVSARLVRRLVNEVKQGKVSAEDAARQLAGPCVCGVFNPERAARLLTLMAQRGYSGSPPQPGQTVAS